MIGVAEPVGVSVGVKDSIGVEVGVSVGVVEGQPLLDLCYEEDSRADVDMNLVMTGSSRFVEVQASAERQVFDDAQLQSMMGLARKGLASLLIKQRGVLSEISPVHGS